ncbi:galactokinase-like [Ylistrum balloti]|uniref:galactokinase-like n=1 Tax=Ylistrum balloti TaxID=509963 RepID=UPI0029058D37|nr:galactokinase-like [Ylistrum balloti]
MSADTKKSNIDIEHAFNTQYGYKAQSIASAHARVNLIGEHTDYNNGLVLPTLLPLTTNVAAAIHSSVPEDTVVVCSTFEEQEDSGRAVGTTHTLSLLEKKRGMWTDYVIASLREVKKHIRGPLPGLALYIHSSIPAGAGISSSAALEVALIRVVKTLLSIEIGDMTIATMAQRAENEYIGLPCGLMDQMVISLAFENHALCINFYDQKQPSYEPAPLFKNHVFLVVFSGISHRLAEGDGGYKTRFAQCQEACKQLHIASLSQLSVQDLQSHTLQDTILCKRVEHVVQENKRVRDAYAALIDGDIQVFAECMNTSHISQRDLYQCSIPEIDILCEESLAHGALGARITGGGFGGAIVLLVHEHKKEKLRNAILAQHKEARILAELTVP